MYFVHGRHFEFRHGFLPSVIFVIGGNSAVLKNIIPITVSHTIGMMMPLIKPLYRPITKRAYLTKKISFVILSDPTDGTALQTPI